MRHRQAAAIWTAAPQESGGAAGDGGANEGGGSGGISSSGGIVRLSSRNPQRATIKESNKLAFEKSLNVIGQKKKRRRSQSDGVLVDKTRSNVPGARRFVLRVRQKAKSNQSLAEEEDKVVEVKQGAAALPAGFNAPPRRDGNSRLYTSLNNKTCRLFTSPASISRIITGQSLSSLLCVAFALDRISQNASSRQIFFGVNLWF